MLSREYIINKLNELSGELKSRFTACKIGLFGSAVRGQLSEGSDIDILVELESETFDNYMDLKFFLEETFGCPIDLVLTNTIKPAIKPHIDREVIYATGA